MIRYRTGIDRKTGQPLRGWRHVEQSIGVILTTLFEERIMLLDFGSDLVRHIGRNLVPPVVLAIYRDAVAAIHRWEPEYRVAEVALEGIDRTGRLALRTKGIYFPEGRLGNYTIQEDANAAFPIAAAEVLGRDR